jgi:hypothetical protein
VTGEGADISDSDSEVTVDTLQGFNLHKYLNEFKHFTLKPPGTFISQRTASGNENPCPERVCQPKYEPAPTTFKYTISLEGCKDTHFFCITGPVVEKVDGQDMLLWGNLDLQGHPPPPGDPPNAILKY